MSLFRRKRKQAPGPAPEHEEADSGFGAVGRSPLVFLSFYLDLPLDAGISEGHGFNEIEFSKPALEDWAGFDLQAFLGMPTLPEQAVHPCTSLRFHRVTNEVPPPIANVIKTVGPRLPRDYAVPDDLPPFLESRSVVEVTRIVPRESTEFGNEWLHEQFTTVLSVLNTNLLALGAAADDHRIGPITERQLPPLILGFQGDMRNVRGGRIPNLAAFHLLLHEGRGARDTDHDGGVINYAMAIADRSGLGLPFFSTMEFTFAARRSFDMGLYSQAVLETGTAIELLVNRVVRGIELDKGSSEERIENVLETAFMNLVKDHLAKKLGVAVDKQFSGSDPLNNWLRVAYQLRNRVAHTGHRPTVQEAIEAMRLAEDLVHFVSEAAERHSGFGITFPSYDELKPSPMLDERSLAKEDESAVFLPRREAFRRGLAALEAGDTAAAKLDFAEADEKGSPNAAYNYASLCLAEGDNDAGLAALRRASERHHPAAPAYLGVYLLRDGNEEEAERFFRQAHAAHPKGGSLSAYFLAVIADGRGDKEEAADYYRDASVFDEFELAGESAFRRGNILKELGDPGAADAYKRGAELGDAKSASNFANELREQGRPDEATAAYERALELADDETEGHIAFNLANALDQLGRPNDAKPLYERAATFGEPWSQVRLGGMAAEAGEMTKARDYLSGANAIDDSTVRERASRVASDFNIRLDL
jgi:tetratricopeptide (TPR) repeat protein